MGARHAVYGVKDCHYKTVGNALVWTLEKASRADFTGETKAAWKTTYQLLADTMKDGSRQQAVTTAIV